MLINSDIVGKRFENFSFGFNERYDEHGNRLFGRMADCESFRQIDTACKANYGPKCVPIVFNISSDKTYTDRQGNIKLQPLLVTCGNLDQKTLKRPSAYELVGYVPMLPINNQLLSRYLGQANVATQTNQKAAAKMVRKYFHQDYMSTILEPVKTVQAAGPIAVAIGSSMADDCEEIIVEAMVYVRLFICKYIMYKLYFGIMLIDTI